uniref:Uncharacterized protein n=1 Tax=viral metagenome TaxID=1070528 RepID=A0A6C0CHB3_9ZZZZ
MILTSNRNKSLVRQVSLMSTLMKHFLKCGETTEHYYVTFDKPSLKCYNGWRCWPCKKQRLEERERTQNYRNTLSCRRCGESRLVQLNAPTR